MIPHTIVWKPLLGHPSDLFQIDSLIQQPTHQASKNVWFILPARMFLELLWLIFQPNVVLSSDLALEYLNARYLNIIASLLIINSHDKANETDNWQSMKNETIILIGGIGKATVQTGFGCLVSTSCGLFGQLGQVKATRFIWVTWVLVLRSISQHAAQPNIPVAWSRRPDLFEPHGRVFKSTCFSRVSTPSFISITRSRQPDSYESHGRE